MKIANRDESELRAGVPGQSLATQGSRSDPPMSLAQDDVVERLRDRRRELQPTVARGGSLRRGATFEPPRLPTRLESLRGEATLALREPERRSPIRRVDGGNFETRRVGDQRSCRPVYVPEARPMVEVETPHDSWNGAAHSRTYGGFAALGVAFCLAILLPLSCEGQPVITVQPQDAAVCPGDSATFYVEALGSELSFIWHSNDVAVATSSGQTNSYFSIPNVQPTNHSNLIYVSITSPAGDVQSRTALLSVLDPSLCQQPPHFLVEPVNQSVCPGRDAVFSAAATGSQPMDFHWFWKGQVFSYYGQTNSTLTLTNVHYPDHESYVSVLVSNLWGQQFSSNATLFVPDPIICESPTNTSAPVGGSFSFSVVAESMTPLSYQWWFRRNGLPSGAPLTNDFIKIFGAQSSNLLITSAAATNGGFYWVAVTNHFGAGVTSRMALCFIGNPPTVGDPTSRIVRVNGTTQFNPPFSGTGLTFQWFQNDVAIPGATGPILVRGPVQRPHVGLYHLRVSNGAGVATSPKAHLQVRLTLEGSMNIYREEATDVIDSLTNAIPVSFAPPPTAVFHGVPLLFSTYNATAQAGETNCLGPARHSMWVRYQAPRAQPTLVSTEGSSFDTVVAVYTWDQNPKHDPIEQECDDNGGYDRRTSRLYFTPVAGRVYYVAVDGVGDEQGTVRLQIGENFRNVRFHPDTGTFQFELAGAYWTNNLLRSTLNLRLPVFWTPELLIPKSTNDWVIVYTNTNALAVPQRYYGLDIVP